MRWSLNRRIRHPISYSKIKTLKPLRKIAADILDAAEKFYEIRKYKPQKSFFGCELSYEQESLSQ